MFLPTLFDIFVMKMKRVVAQNIQSDNQLLDEYRRTKNAGIVGVLFERYTHLVFGVCMKYLKNEEDSKDAVMQIFENLLEELKTQEVSYFKSWLYIVTRNHCLMKLRKLKNIHFEEFAAQKSEENFVEFDIELHHTNEKATLDVKKSLEKLKPEQKICVELFYIKEMSYKQIVKQTNFTLKQVKSYIENGKRNLKNILQENG